MPVCKADFQSTAMFIDEKFNAAEGKLTRGFRSLQPDRMYMFNLKKGDYYMADKNMKSDQQNLADISERDWFRYEKMIRNKKTANLLCMIEDQDIKATFFENGQVKEVICLDVNFIDSEGVIHELAQNQDTLIKMQIFFPSYYKIFVVYAMSDQSEPKFCSWGYKKSSARTEKLFVYFKTKYSAYMACADAKHPEYQFLLWADDIGSHNPIQNQHQFLRSLIREDSELYERVL